MPAALLLLLLLLLLRRRANLARSDRTLNPHPVSKVSSLCGDGACR